EGMQAWVGGRGGEEGGVGGDAEWPGDLDDRPRHVDVGARGGGIAGGMVVHEPVIPPNILNFRNSPRPSNTVRAGTGGCSRCASVIITLDHDASQRAVVTHGR